MTLFIFYKSLTTFQIFIFFISFWVKLLLFWSFQTLLYHCLKLLLLYKVLNSYLLKLDFILDLIMIIHFIFFLIFMKTPTVLFLHLLIEFFCFFALLFLLCEVDNIENDLLFKQVEISFLTSIFSFVFLYYFNDVLVIFYNFKDFLLLLEILMFLHITITLNLSIDMYTDLQSGTIKSFFE